MKYLMIVFAVIVMPMPVACGPSWKDVIIHDGGVCENPKKPGKCWLCQSYEPVDCPTGNMR